MRVLSIACLMAVFVGHAQVADARPTLVDVPEQDKSTTYIRTHIDLPLADLLPGNYGHMSYLDKAKHKAALTGVYFASNDATQRNDAKFQDTVLDGAVAVSSAQMNTRFYGSLIIFAAGCMLYLGMTIRRYP